MLYIPLEYRQEHAAPQPHCPRPRGRGGLALLDPHGDLAEAALAYIPRTRTNDLVYVNPADIDRPTGFNPLSRVPDDLKPIVADGIVSAFRHVWPESWGPRLDYILTNAVRSLLDVPGATLLMLPRLLIDETFRAQLVDHHVGDPVVRSFWVNEYAAIPTASAICWRSQEARSYAPAYASTYSK